MTAFLSPPFRWHVLVEGKPWPPLPAAERKRLELEHPAAGGDLCLDDGSGCCGGCGVSLETCPECHGLGYHRDGCPGGGL